MKAQLFLGPLDLSPFIVGENKFAACLLSDLTLEIEKDIFRVLHAGRDSWRSGYMTVTPLYVSWIQKPLFVLKSDYSADGKLRLRLNRVIIENRNGSTEVKSAAFYLINTNNEWWRKDNGLRKSVQSYKQKSLF